MKKFLLFMLVIIVAGGAAYMLNNNFKVIVDDMYAKVVTRSKEEIKEIKEPEKEVSKPIAAVQTAPAQTIPAQTIPAQTAAPKPKEVKKEEPIKKSEKLSVLDKKHFIPYNYESCLELCKKMLKSHGITTFGDQSAVFKLMHEVEKGGKRQLLIYGNNPTENYKNATECIDRHLDKNRPIIVGVNHSIGYQINNNEGATDHFVLIVGRGYDATLKKHFYTYYDPGSTSIEVGTDLNDNRFIYDPVKNTLRDETPVMKKITSGAYDITQVRPNDGDTSKTTGLYI